MIGIKTYKTNIDTPCHNSTGIYSMTWIFFEKHFLVFQHIEIFHHFVVCYVMMYSNATHFIISWFTWLNQGNWTLIGDFSVSEQLVGLVSVFFICTSILSFCLKTHPNLRVPVIRNFTVESSYGPLAHNWTSTYWTLDKTRTEPHKAFFFVELASFFSIPFFFNWENISVSIVC